MKNARLVLAALALTPGVAMAQPNLLFNAGFELDDPNFQTAPLGWSTFNQGGRPSTLYARSGLRSLEIKFRVSDDFVGTWNNYFDPDLISFPYVSTTLYKSAPLNISGWVLVPNDGAITAGTTFASVKIDVFRTANGSIYQSFEFQGSVPSTTNGQWIPYNRTINPSDFGSFDFEPAVGASVRTAFMMFMFNGAVTPGNQAAVYWDDMSLTQGSAPCYANCDGSTTAPVLGPADFSCFLGKFRAGDGYANCDGSTTAPVLGPADFSCFLSKFRAGC